MIRKPLVAGQFYEASFEALENQLNGCFNSEFGPGALPIKKRDKIIVGGVTPHAGYMFSGACAAWFYKEVGESKFPQLYIILGLSHSGFDSCITFEDFETPLGVVKTDKEFLTTLIKKSSLKEDSYAHAQEHSIEVQIPFLQFVNRDYLDMLKIAPIIVSDDIKPSELASSIFNALEETKKTACVIASSDFTHFGLNYGYFPFNSDIKENLYKLDKGAIEHILNLNSLKFLHYIEETGATICGKMPIAVMIELCKLLNAKKARLLHYYTSGDVIKDYNSAVGYASILVI